MRVSIQNLTKRFASTTVLHNVSIEVADREVNVSEALEVLARGVGR